MGKIKNIGSEATYQFLNRIIGPTVQEIQVKMNKGKTFKKPVKNKLGRKVFFKA